MTRPDDSATPGTDASAGAVALILPDGRRITLDQDVVIGRAPIAPDGSPAARSVSLGAPTVSKTHALVGRDAGVVWALDLHSSNGSEIVDPSGTATSLVPGVRSTIAPGCHLRFGTDVVVIVERPLDADEDVTVVLPATSAPEAPAGSVIPDQPGRDGQALPAASEAVDWSVVMDPAPGSPSPLAPPDVPATPSAPARPHPPAYSPASPPTTQFAAVNPSGYPSAQPPPPAPPPFDTGASGGRSTVHVLGALVVLVWGLVSGWRLLEIGTDVLFENLDGWPSRFFAQVSRDEFEFVELFSVVGTPDVLSPIVYVIAAAICALALLALVTPNRVVRYLAVAAVGVEVFLMAGFAIDFFVAVGTESLEFTLPNFVLPVIGCGLLLWPSTSSTGRPPSLAPQAQPGVFYAPQQPPPPGAPPSGGHP